MTGCVLPCCLLYFVFCIFLLYRSWPVHGRLEAHSQAFNLSCDCDLLPSLCSIGPNQKGKFGQALRGEAESKRTPVDKNKPIIMVDVAGMSANNKSRKKKRRKKEERQQGHVRTERTVEDAVGVCLTVSYY